MGDKLRTLQAEQASAVAELANVAAAAPMLPSRTVLRERIRSLCDLTGAYPSRRLASYCQG